MYGWIVVIVWLWMMPTLVMAQDNNREDEQSLEERVKAVEERLEKLDRVEVIKQVREYVCPGGEIYDSLPPGGRCPDGSVPDERATFRKLFFSRRESVAEKIEAALEEAEKKRVAVGGSARGILQQVVHNPAGDQLFSEGSIDLFFLSRPMTSTTFFVDLEAIGGTGPDEVVGSLSRLNTDAETLGVTDEVKVREVWLHMRLFSDRLQIIGGKLDLTNYFDLNAVANDETTKFLNTALVNNPLLRQPVNGPGGAIRYEAGRDWTIGLGVQSPNNSGSTIAEKVYTIVELDYHAYPFFSREGNYRLWGRLGRVPDALEKETWGVGISLDQQITTRTTVFARVGLGRMEDDGKSTHAWSTGFEVRSPFSMWTRDRFGIAFSRQVDVQRSESIGEGYYHHYLTDRFAVAFDLQWLFSGTHSGTGEKNENVAIPGFRTTINF
jgi:hypothetical protein